MQREDQESPKIYRKSEKKCGWYGPSGVGGIDYSKESFPSTHISFAEGLEMIDRDTEKINQLTEERKDLRRTMRRVKKSTPDFPEWKHKVYYCRVIQKKNTSGRRGRNRTFCSPVPENRKRYEGQRADLKMKIF